MHAVARAGFGGRRTTVPVRLRARERRPGAPSPTPGTVSALVRNTADGARIWIASAGDDSNCCCAGRLSADPSADAPPPGGSGSGLVGSGVGVGGLCAPASAIASSSRSRIQAGIVERIAATTVRQRQFGGHPDVLLGDRFGAPPGGVRDRGAGHHQVGAHTVDVERRTQRGDPA